ncbi:MAG: TIM44-like domain-containing protein [Lachnospiraceae bacterium]|nr:TIM44-like domain-containing protein [Lachnospiraceae bacterium]
MNKKQQKRLFMIVAVILLMLTLCFVFKPVNAIADFGNFAGDSDYGGGGGGSDSGSSYGDDIAFDFLTTIIVVIIFAVMILFFMIKEALFPSKKKNRGEMAGIDYGNGFNPIGRYRELDPNFNEAKLREKLANLYIQMQQKWHEKNIESLKPYFTDAFYNQSNLQLNEFRQFHRTPCTERVAVLEVSFIGFYQNAGMDHILVKMRTRIVAYVLDDRTGRVISGDMRREKFMEYEWDICRKSGVRTRMINGMSSIHCPYCGAPLNINETAKCAYCGSVVTVVNEDWTLNNIRGISQKTV